MAPKEIRGKLGSMFHFLFTCGVMTSYWVDYGVSENLPAVTKQWQIPIGLQVRGPISRYDLDSALRSGLLQNWNRGGKIGTVTQEQALIQ